MTWCWVVEWCWQMVTWRREPTCWWRKCLIQSWLVKVLLVHSIMLTAVYCRSLSDWHWQYSVYIHVHSDRQTDRQTVRCCIHCVQHSTSATDSVQANDVVYHWQISQQFLLLFESISCWGEIPSADMSNPEMWMEFMTLTRQFFPFLFAFNFVDDLFAFNVLTLLVGRQATSAV